MTTAPAKRFATATSVLLDALRLAAAVAIASAHLTQSIFSANWPNLTDYGKPALVMLFLLSGLVIRYVTQVRRGRMTDFWIDRISRVYSVVVPALVFTIIASYLAMRINPAYYMPNWGADSTQPVFRIAVNLVFMAQSWNQTIAPFSNNPFWTLSYEVFYYVLYAVGIYLAGARRIFWLLIIAVLAGQHILLLLPLWLIGCLAHDVYQRVGNLQLPLRKLNLIFLITGVAGAALIHPMSQFAIQVKGYVTRFFWAHHHAPMNLHWAYVYYAEGLPIVFLLLWAMLLFDRLQLTEKAAWVKWLRLFSEATFPLYLLHFPLYVLLVSAFPGIRANAWLRVGMLVLAIAISLLLARPTVEFKNYLRDLLRKFVVRPRPVPAIAAVETASRA